MHSGYNQQYLGIPAVARPRICGHLPAGRADPPGLLDLAGLRPAVPVT